MKKRDTSKPKPARRINPGIALGWLCCALMIVSCTDERIVSGDPEEKGDRISFGVDVVETRGAVSTTANLTSMGVYGYYTSLMGWTAAAATATPNYFDNKAITKSGGSWAYSPLKYWPANTAENITFFAYAPHTGHTSVSGKLTAAESSPGVPTLSYTVENDVTQQVDLLRATPVKDQGKIASALSFDMKHALTRVAFSAALDTGEDAKSYTATVTNITITDVKNKGSLNLSTGVWTPDALSTDTYVLNTTNGLNTTTSNNVFNTATTGDFTTRSLITDNAYLMLMPHQLTSTAKLSITITYTGGTMNETITSDFNLEDLLIEGAAEWVSGKAVEYVFKIKGRFVNLSVYDWSDPEQGGTVVDGQNYLKVSDYDIDMVKWANDNARITVTTNLASWSAQVQTNPDGFLTLKDVTTGATITTATGTSGGQLRFAVSQYPLTTGTRTGSIRITAGTMQFDVDVIQGPEDRDFKLRLSHSELLFAGRKLGGGGTFSAPDPQDVSIDYGPQSYPYTMSLSPYVGGGLDIQGFTFPGTSSVGEMTIALDMISDTDPNVVENPFYERSSRLGFTVQNEDNSETITKQILIRQVYYSLLVTGMHDYYFHDYTYTLTLRSNTAWIATFTGDESIFASRTGTSGNGVTSTTGEKFTFKIASTATPGATSTVTFSSPDNLFPPQSYTIIAEDHLPNSYIVAPGGGQQDIPVRKAYRVWEHDRDLGTDLSLLPNNHEVKILWQDEPDLITVGTLSANNKNGTFRVTTNANATKQGNAVVAYLINGKIYWSWHIWVTPYDPYVAAGQKTANGYTIMDRNIGALRSEPVVGDNAENLKMYGLYYLAGRNNPFPGPASVTSTTFRAIYGPSGSTPLTGSDGLQFPAAPTGLPADGGPNLANAIQNPMSKYLGSYGNSHWNGQLIEQRDDFWQYAYKTDYDPCPAGYRVAINNVNANFQASGTVANYAITFSTEPNAGYFPSTGRGISHNNQFSLGTQVVLWVMTPTHPAGYSYNTGSHSGTGYLVGCVTTVVRCMKD